MEKRNSQMREIWQHLRKNKTAMLGLLIIIIVVSSALFADVIADYDTKVIKQNANEIFQSPSAKHFFGTDSYGRDIFARIIHGSRRSLSIGLVSTIIGASLGVLIGATAGYYGGKIDEIIMRLLDVQMSIPPLLLALAIVAALGPGLRNLLIAITISMAPGFARVVRAVVLSVADEEFVEAAKACGTKDYKIIFIHILPNAIGPIIVQTTMAIAGMILAGAGLSYIGMGIQPPDPEWGAMLAQAQNSMRQYPYLVFFPGMSLILTSLAFNLLGDGLRDALDPKLRS